MTGARKRSGRDLSSALLDDSAVLQGKRAARAGQGFARGWGVFALPFDSGHVLALRVFPDSDAGPYRSLWHRDPAGTWTLHVQGPHLETACPRYFGEGFSSIGFATIDIEWAGPSAIRVRANRPALDWLVTASESMVLRPLNAVSARLPLWTFRPGPLMRARETVARGLGMGTVQLVGTTPSGRREVVMARRMYFIDESTATLDGIDLGRPVHMQPNPQIGGVALPARGILAIGQATWDPPTMASIGI